MHDGGAVKLGREGDWESEEARELEELGEEFRSRIDMERRRR